MFNSMFKRRPEMEEKKYVLLANFTNEETAELLSWHK